VSAHRDIVRAVAALCPGSGFQFSGDVYPDGIVFDDPTVVRPTLAQVQAQMAKPVVPQSVSRLQAMVALSQAGLLAAAQNWVATQDATTQLIWNSASTFSRQSALLATAAAALGWTSDQVDQLFITAATINP